MKKHYIALTLLIGSIATNLMAPPPPPDFDKKKSTDSTTNTMNNTAPTNQSEISPMLQNPRITITTPPPSSKAESPDLVIIAPEEEKKDQPHFDTILWNAKKHCTAIPAAKVPMRQKSILNAVTPYSYPATIKTINALTLEKLEPQKITELRRQVSKAIMEMLEEIEEKIITPYKANLPQLLPVLQPAMLKLVQFADNADKLNLLDDELQLQIHAWVEKYKHHVTTYAEQNEATITHYQKGILDLCATIGFTNDYNRAIYSLQHLNPDAVKNHSSITSQANDLLATLVRHLIKEDQESDTLVEQINKVIQLSQKKGIILGKSELAQTASALKAYKRRVPVQELYHAIESTLKSAQLIKKTEKITQRVLQETYINSTNSEDKLSDNEYDYAVEPKKWMEDIKHLLLLAAEQEKSEQ